MVSFGSAIGVEIENTYEYLGHEFDDPEDLFGPNGLLNFDLHMKKDIREYTNKDVEETLKFAAELAKEFVDAQHPANPYTHYKATKNLRNSIYYDTETSQGGYGGRLYANAMDSRGHKYAGHIEYGFTDRAGLPHGPWPFLRPAIRMALSATRANFADSVSKGLLYGEITYSQRSIGSRNARENFVSVFGGVGRGARSIQKEFQSFGTKYQGKGEGRWDYAQNGIGFKSGVQWGDRASSIDWMDGSF